MGRIAACFCVIVMSIACPWLAGQSLTWSLVSNLDNNAIRLSWSLDRPSASSVRYGTSPVLLDHQAFSLAVASNHSLIIRDLAPGTTYYYAISANGRQQSAVKTFVTSGEPAFKVLESGIVTNGKTYLVFGWKANQKCVVTVSLVPVGRTDRRSFSSGRPSGSGTLRVPGLSPLTAYYYLVEYSTTNGLSFKDRVKAVTTAEDDLALGKPVLGTFTEGITNDPYFIRVPNTGVRVTDGKMNYFDGMAVSRDIAVSNQWAIVDLGENRAVSKILVSWRSLACSTNYTVSVSRDAKVWTDVAVGLNALKGRFSRGERGDPVLTTETACPAGTSARYVRMTAVKNGYHAKHEGWRFVQLMEIKVYP